MDVPHAMNARRQDGAHVKRDESSSRDLIHYFASVRLQDGGNGGSCSDGLYDPLRPRKATLIHSHLKVQLVVPGTTRVEARVTARALAPTAQILIDGQFAAAAAAEHGFCVAFVPCPYLWGMPGQGFVAADAGVVLAAALVSDGDDVQVGVPMGAFCCGRDVDAVDEGVWWRGFGV